MKIIVVSVHPDDETLGCGGTLLKHKDNQDEISWLIITRGDQSIGISKEALDKREKEIKKVAKVYGFKNIHRLNFIATKLQENNFNEIINKVSEVMHKEKPEIVYTANRSDVHTDHQIAAKAIFSCTKSFRYPFVKRVLMYECISETEFAPALPENVFIPNAFSDISNYIDKKIETLSLYESELKEAPFPRSIENIKALARFRGSTIGVDYAEAFMLMKDIF